MTFLSNYCFLGICEKRTKESYTPILYKLPIPPKPAVLTQWGWGVRRRFSKEMELKSLCTCIRLSLHNVPKTAISLVQVLGEKGEAAKKRGG